MNSEFLYAAAQKVYPRTVNGVYAIWRWRFVLLTQIAFYGLPWLVWGQRQMILFNLESRRFYVFGMVLYPQDFIYLSGLLIICALSLFLFTALAGRLWCGFACPQTVYSEIFMWVERTIEGDRSARIKLDNSNIYWIKILKKVLKHVIWIAISFWTGFTFVAYFTPAKILFSELITFNFSSWEVFWIAFYGLATYGNAGFMREQVCKYMCPYARFQSAMFDKDTLLVTYDQGRGEPRGGRARGGLKTIALGDCVDCTLCVQVCPTGIDIRNGLQYECIGCGACIDVCNSVMSKMNYQNGLIRFSTENALANLWSNSEVIRRLFRCRIIVYFLILLLIILIWVISLSSRIPFRVDVIRDRYSISQLSDHQTIQNVYRLQLMNAIENYQTFSIAVSGVNGISIVSNSKFVIEPTQSKWIVLRLEMPELNASAGSHQITFEIYSEETGYLVKEPSVFLVSK